MVYAVSCGCFCDVKRASVFLMASIAALYSPLAIAPARAFDFFGLLGSEEDAPPPSPEVLPYKLEFTGVDDDKALAQNLKDASNVWRLRLQAPASGAGLTRRVVGDFPNLADALWASGYFDAQVEATVAGVEIYPGWARN
jgi:translocation and assembly module TamA